MLQRSSPVDVDIKHLLQLKAVASRLPPLPQWQHAVALGQGWSSNRLGRGIEFSEVRAYQAGDDVRHMDWRVMARTGKPHTQLYQEERGRPVLLLVDESPCMQFATQGAFKSVIAADIAAMLGWAAISHGDKVGGMVLHQKQPEIYLPSLQQKAFLRFLQRLSTKQEKKAAPSLQQATNDVMRMPRGTQLIVITDGYCLEEKNQDCLAQLSSRHSILLCWIRDAIECAAPPPGHYSMIHGSDRLTLDMMSKTSRQHYDTWCQQRAETLKRYCAKHRIPLWSFTTCDNISACIYRYSKGLL